jgi:S-DNA-T family DNA segregation ATPase FtsK/SpoIIIE
VGGLPVLGLDSVQLAPYTFNPQGVMLIAGPPASGKTNALAAIVQAMVRARPAARCYLFAPGPSTLVDAVDWVDTAQTIEASRDLAMALIEAVKDPDIDPGIIMAFESYNEYLQSVADKSIVELVKATRNSGHLLVAEAETSSWNSTWPIYAEVKTARRGLLLQPEAMDGDAILKTSLPRTGKGEFPPGRGVYVARGKYVRVQLPLVLNPADQV